jgi:Tetracyclin repressor-like, C-terminal domain
MRVIADQQPYLGCLDSWEAWQQWRNVVIKRYAEQGDQCPLGQLTLHLGRTTPGTRALVAQLMDRWQEYLAVGMRSLQAAGRLPSDLDVEERSASLLAAIQGGVAILQATGRIYHLRAALDMGIADLRRVGAMHDEAAASAAGRA